jgi:hypothetical protein
VDSNGCRRGWTRHVAEFNYSEVTIVEVMRMRWDFGSAGGFFGGADTRYYGGRLRRVAVESQSTWNTLVELVLC